MFIYRRRQFPAASALPVLQPQEHVASDAAKTNSAFRLPPSALTYTCPMHPEIVRDRPGSLPDLRDGAGAEGRDGGRGAES